MDSKTITKIKDAIQKEEADTLLALIHKHIHIENGTDGQSHVIYHEKDSIDIIEEISAALVEADAGDFFRELCLKGATDYDIQDFPAAGGRSILSLAKKHDARSMIDALEHQDAKDIDPVEPDSVPQKPVSPVKKSFAMATYEEPTVLQHFRTALIHGYGLPLFRSKLIPQADSLADDFFFLAMQHSINENALEAAVSYIEAVRDAKTPISPSTWKKVMSRAMNAENFEIASAISTARTLAIAELPPAPNPFDLG